MTPCPPRTCVKFFCCKLCTNMATFCSVQCANACSSPCLPKVRIQGAVKVASSCSKVQANAAGAGMDAAATAGGADGPAACPKPTALAAQHSRHCKFPIFETEFNMDVRVSATIAIGQHDDCDQGEEHLQVGFKPYAVRIRRPSVGRSPRPAGTVRQSRVLVPRAGPRARLRAPGRARQAARVNGRSRVA